MRARSAARGVRGRKGACARGGDRGGGASGLGVGVRASERTAAESSRSGAQTPRPPRGEIGRALRPARDKAATRGRARRGGRTAARVVRSHDEAHRARPSPRRGARGRRRDPGRAPAPARRQAEATTVASRRRRRERVAATEANARGRRDRRARRPRDRRPARARDHRRGANPRGAPRRDRHREPPAPTDRVRTARRGGAMASRRMAGTGGSRRQRRRRANRRPRIAASSASFFSANARRGLKGRSCARRGVSIGSARVLIGRGRPRVDRRDLTPGSVGSRSAEGISSGL